LIFRNSALDPGWLLVSVLNLLLVALLGTLMRYKIAFSFPFLDQKHLQFAHSHFAFVGWITHTLLFLMVNVLANSLPGINLRKYRMLIVLNLISAYGMLVFFIIQAYGPISIAFSTLSVLVNYFFAWNFIRDLRQAKPSPYNRWFRAALWFAVLSSLGTLALAYAMGVKTSTQKLHLASLYFYLHFQYNGFFFFACMGLLIGRLHEDGISIHNNSRVFRMFWVACIPAYFLSILWINLPIYIYLIVIAAAFLQCGGWLLFLKEIWNASRLRDSFGYRARYFLLLIAISLSVKLLLQLGSTVPAIGQLAFGFRHIIIAYLHLVLLAIISAFLLTYIHFGFPGLKIPLTGLLIFVPLIYVNELVLGAQGIGSLTYSVIPYVDEVLFAISLCIVLGVLVMLWKIRSAIRSLSSLENGISRTAPIVGK
jgi:hypothetical protein